jgi:ABC-type multidrug transport system ATPase subunit
MGPSGSGKTTLLNLLAHRSLPRRAEISGDIFINSTKADLKSLRDTSSYVEQQDHLIGSITTAETVTFAAKLGLKQCV